MKKYAIALHYHLEWPGFHQRPNTWDRPAGFSHPHKDPKTSNRLDLPPPRNLRSQVKCCVFLGGDSLLLKHANIIYYIYIYILSSWCWRARILGARKILPSMAFFWLTNHWTKYTKSWQPILQSAEGWIPITTLILTASGSELTPQVLAIEAPKDRDKAMAGHWHPVADISATWGMENEKNRVNTKKNNDLASSWLNQPNWKILCI